MKELLKKIGSSDSSVKYIDLEIETYGDHRIAMVFSLAALGEIPITIIDPDCTKKTFPNYFTASTC